MSRTLLSLLSFFLLASLASSQTSDPKRLEVLFLGDNRGHNPIERFRVLKQALAPKGYNLTYMEDLADLTRERLDLHDALIVYANHESDTLPETVIPWVKDGGGLVALHSACGCFHPSPDWFALVGGRFKSHEGHVFSPRTTNPNHPITQELPKLTAWDETYVHQSLGSDLNILQKRDPINQGETAPEPWTWTRSEGEGRVFYTASGHDLRVWTQQAYQELVERGILWAVGEGRAAEFSTLKLPALEIEVPEVPGRAHPEIPMMPLQKPLSPADSAKHAQVPAGTELVLFASEPMVINPIAIDWDHRGRAWVVESFGYPNDVPLEPGSGKDRIKILEDSNGDGRADKVTVFADGLRHCTTSVFHQGGVVVTDGEDIIFLKDEDGDDQADTRKVLAGGLRIWDTHASTSHFLYGMDNWIYATVGYSGVDITLNGRRHEFGPGVFRFRQDLSELEHLQRTTNNTWGLGFTNDGEVVGSTANNNPSWILSIPERAFTKSGLEQPRTPRLDDKPPFYPNTRDITQVDQLDRYTAAAGHMLYNDRFFKGIIADDSAFICAPTGHLVAMGPIRNRGSLKSINLRAQNLYASADAWSAPVAARSGPDGAIWIADWYNPIVQHNVVFRYWNPARDYDHPHSPYHVGDQKPGKGNAYVTPLRDRSHGRIWRIVPRSENLRKEVQLDPTNVASLVEALNSPSQHIRLQAQRLLVEKNAFDQEAALLKLITSSENTAGSDQPLGAYHAIGTLQGLGLTEALAKGLDSPSSAIRLQAARALDPSHPELVARLPILLEKAKSLSELRHLLTIAAQAPANEPLARAIWQKVKGEFASDKTLRQAAVLAMRKQGSTLLTIAFASEASSQPWLSKELEAITARIAASPNRPVLVSLLRDSSPAIKERYEAILNNNPTGTKSLAELPKALVPGREAYLKSCIECHQADGKGVADTFPPLLNSSWVRSNPDTLLRIMLGGLMGPVEVAGVQYNSAMPGHSHASDEELASVASYVRFAFGGLKEQPISPEQVKALRPETEARKFNPWTVSELKNAAK
ncbi:PVC-type heme-binding CxxCH protein [Roseibacillus persicicus]|uniref:Cytochrome c domain-containing protein n=1 Tax=Roseibacillus persicicus TaxID=454148 RepID=A0A918TJ57_9BACT|nr:PVC-type heme-binding CxxCH protein [Roseibacillus persicicus]GHC50392.1 hypothetical protein GCM10007100_15630 [Roseibacillus persicicus]